MAENASKGPGSRNILGLTAAAALALSGPVLAEQDGVRDSVDGRLANKEQSAGIHEMSEHTRKTIEGLRSELPYIVTVPTSESEELSPEEVLVDEDDPRANKSNPKEVSPEQINISDSINNFALANSRKSSGEMPNFNYYTSDPSINLFIYRAFNELVSMQLSDRDNRKGLSFFKILVNISNSGREYTISDRLLKFAYTNMKESLRLSTPSHSNGSNLLGEHHGKLYDVATKVGKEFSRERNDGIRQDLVVSSN